MLLTHHTSFRALPDATVMQQHSCCCRGTLHWWHACLNLAMSGQLLGGSLLGRCCIQPPSKPPNASKPCPATSASALACQYGDRALPQRLQQQQQVWQATAAACSHNKRAMLVLSLSSVAGLGCMWCMAARAFLSVSKPLQVLCHGYIGKEQQLHCHTCWCRG
jgi:hypothetical protein